MRSLRLIAPICLLFLLNAACKKDNKQSLATISTMAISNISGGEAQSGGTVIDNGGSGITKKGICWSIEPSPDLADSTAESGTGSANFIINITGLSANTIYYVRAFAMNGKGTAYGNELSFSTGAGLPTVTTSTISNIVPLTAAGGGSIINNGGADITARGVCWSTSPNPTIAGFKTEDGNGNGTFTSSLTPLASETVYYIRAYATNSYGTAYGHEVNFKAAAASTVTDVEGNVYTYVTINGIKWMSNNLKTSKYANGDAITDGSVNNFDWLTNTSGAYAYPGGEITNNGFYGKYYNIKAVRDARGICPTGWHIPTDDDWKSMELSQGMPQDEINLRGHRGTIAAKLKEGGFSGLNLVNAGYLFLGGSIGSYVGLNVIGEYWTSTDLDAYNYFRAINIPNGSPDAIYRSYSFNPQSVRCIQK